MKVQVEFQEPDRKKKIKRIIAREGLIFLILSAAFITLSYFFPINTTAVNPKFEIIIQDGTSFEIEVVPDLTLSIDRLPLKETMKKWHNPTQALIQRRVAEFAKANKIDIKEYEAIPLNSAELNRDELLIGILASPPLFIAFCVYIFILLIRFIIWAVRTLREKK